MGLDVRFPSRLASTNWPAPLFRIFLPKLSNLHPMLILASRNLQTVQSGEFIFSSYYVSYPLTPFLTNPASLNLQSVTLVACSVLMSSAIDNIPPYSRRPSSWRTKWPLLGLVCVSHPFDSLRIKRLTPMSRRRMPFRLDISTSKQTSQRSGRFVMKYIVVCCWTSWHPLK